MTTITPCLWFDGNGLEAAEHYVSVIPDSRVTDVSYYGLPSSLTSLRAGDFQNAIDLDFISR